MALERRREGQRWTHNAPRDAPGCPKQVLICSATVGYRQDGQVHRRLLSVSSAILLGLCFWQDLKERPGPNRDIARKGPIMGGDQQHRRRHTRCKEAHGDD